MCPIHQNSSILLRDREMGREESKREKNFESFIFVLKDQIDR
jgi:hypothetical protein